MDIKDWLIILATIMGPILAVQAQKAVEAYRERSGRKRWVFQQLMATRAGRTSFEHVQALNMIDLVFYGNPIWGIRSRTKGEQAVLDSWKEYLDLLNSPFDQSNESIWHARREELFINLLFAMSSDAGYSFDRVQLKNGAYSPQAHGQLEEEHLMIRRAALALLTGQISLPVGITSFPENEAASASMRKVIDGLGSAFESGTLSVRVAGSEESR